MASPGCLILCKSVHHGNTTKVATAIAAALHAEIASPEEVPYTSLQGRRLVGFGSGVYYGRMHDALFEWLHGLPDVPEAALPAFLFSTAGLPWLSGLWHEPLCRLLARKGFRIVGQFSCGGYDTWGPLWLAGGLNKKHPHGRDLARAEEFAARLARRLWPSATASQTRGLHVPTLP